MHTHLQRQQEARRGPLTPSWEPPLASCSPPSSPHPPQSAAPQTWWVLLQKTKSPFNGQYCLARTHMYSIILLVITPKPMPSSQCSPTSVVGTACVQHCCATQMAAGSNLFSIFHVSLKFLCMLRESKCQSVPWLMTLKFWKLSSSVGLRHWKTDTDHYLGCDITTEHIGLCLACTCRHSTLMNCPIVFSSKSVSTEHDSHAQACHCCMLLA